MGTTARIYSTGLLLAYPFVYLAHLVDERYWWIGTADFATQYLGMYFTNTVWWWVNVPSMVLLSVATALVVRGVWPQWAALSLAVHLLIHGLGRVPSSLWTSEIAPGLITGVLLCMPLAVVTFWIGRGKFGRGEIIRGVGYGTASFQPFWHAALLPFLPGPPQPGPVP